MGWYVRYMAHFEGWARGMAGLGLGDGYTAYSNRQADMWRRQGVEARNIFGDKLALAAIPGDEDPVE